MARYLTPVRIGILILTEQYLSGQFASSGQLGVLSFIASHITARGGSTGKEGQDAFVGLDANAAEILGPLAKFASDVPGRTAYDALLQRLWKLDGLDAAYEDLPEEIVELCLEGLDIGSLQNLRLVNRFFNPRASKYLYRHVDVHCTEQSAENAYSILQHDQLNHFVTSLALLTPLDP